MNVSTRSERSREDALCPGIAVSRIEERALAVTGQQSYASTLFTPQESVFNAGVLFSLPALISQGLYTLFSSFKPLPRGFYGLHHILLLLCFMALCRIKNPEQLKKIPVGEMGRLLGLDRIPQVEHFRVKIKQITDQCRCDQLHQALFQEWTNQMADSFFYIDGHVRVYSGELARLPKHFVSREKLCLSATSEFYVNTFDGLPLMVINGELNEKLKVAIEQAIVHIKKQVKPPTDPNEPHFTLVFDREAYEPRWFKKLWDEERIAIISYRKNVKDRWDEKAFENAEIEVNNTTVTMQLCECGSNIQGAWFREIRKLSKDAHQTSIITTHPSLAIRQVAAKMFTRWSQENFFKYMTENFDFDRMIEYGTQELADKQVNVVNPAYRTLTYQLDKTKGQMRRLQAKLYEKMEQTETIEQMEKIMLKNAVLTEQINEYKERIDELTTQRKNTSHKITVDQMPEEKRFNKLKEESKKLKNAILMLAYRAESSLYGSLDGVYMNTKKDGRMLLKEIFTSNADLIPNYQSGIMTIRLHSLSTPRANKAAKELCNLLNETQTCYPMTNLRMVYETIAD